MGLGNGRAAVIGGTVSNADDKCLSRAWTNPLHFLKSSSRGEDTADEGAGGTVGEGRVEGGSMAGEGEILAEGGIEGGAEEGGREIDVEAEGRIVVDA